ncbi:DUF1488 domain-containing protein [Stappia sp. ES.058]|uniref:DUF1488 domain-containing protein n=1 Tax=Stappia sp. ES.058 TaxID=1881061 RepID=UPI00087ADE58|nr:DUF1488 domain-containing protein [Stappia sp. ES.058]SDU24995.1 Protein of unknown function [Stappia sp. ES.058]
MALSFPNPSRSFDAARKGVRFIAHDGVFEVTFLVELSALMKSDKALADNAVSASRDSTQALEDQCLSAFDRQRSFIQDVARQAYSNAHHPSYTLVSSDFR